MWQRIRSFVSDNIILVVMVPGIIGAHYAWLKIQMVDQFVSPEERNLEQPIVRAFNAFKDEVLRRASGEGENETTNKASTSTSAAEDKKINVNVKKH